MFGPDETAEDKMSDAVGCTIMLAAVGLLLVICAVVAIVRLA